MAIHMKVLFLLAILGAANTQDDYTATDPPPTPQTPIVSGFVISPDSQPPPPLDSVEPTPKMDFPTGNVGSSDSMQPLSASENPGVETPVAEPAVAEPPVAEPLVAEPPVAEPPVAEPPVAVLPDAMPSVADPQVANSTVPEPINSQLEAVTTESTIPVTPTTVVSNNDSTPDTELNAIGDSEESYRSGSPSCGMYSHRSSLGRSYNPEATIEKPSEPDVESVSGNTNPHNLNPFEYFETQPRKCTPEDKTCEMYFLGEECNCDVSFESEGRYRCIPSFVRNRFGKCVQPSECCEDPNSWLVSGPNTGPGGTCAFPNFHNCDHSWQPYGCQCKPGFVKISEENPLCIRLEDCNEYLHCPSPSHS